MKDSRFKTKEIEDKYDKFQKDISNERRFLFHINNLFSAEFKELLEDILILNENQFFIQIKNMGNYHHITMNYLKHLLMVG